MYCMHFHITHIYFKNQSSMFTLTFYFPINFNSKIQYIQICVVTCSLPSLAIHVVSEDMLQG